ncbi:MAG: hypothetical protein LLF94_00655 [Chlamydiales bacterium]|nr:hypothetical protein [Chlamydiales bacterium]
MLRRIQSTPDLQAQKHVQEEIKDAKIVLPNNSHVTIKIAKKHPVADVIRALGTFMIFAASSAITFLYATRQIKEGASLAFIQPALDVLKAMNK